MVNTGYWGRTGPFPAIGLERSSVLASCSRARGHLSRRAFGRQRKKKDKYKRKTFLGDFTVKTFRFSGRETKKLSVSPMTIMTFAPRFMT
jgi:hypothetical protein